MENLTDGEANYTGETENNTPAILAYPEENYSTPFTVLVVFCVIFLVAAVGNLTVFISLFRSRHRKSRISLMIRHLTIADLVVTFVMIPLEIAWRLTVSWLAGNLACKAFLYLRAFGLYLSSNVLVCVSLDRYFAVLHPLKVNDARRRGKCMLTWAWVISLVCAIPQSIVFHVASHPDIENFQQCVTIGFFTSHFQQMAYNLFGLLVMYFIPLFVIIIAYTAIMCEISNKSRDSKRENLETNGRMRLRRSDISNIERARTRTLRMTIMIVVVFVICWTPYVFMTLWYTFDKESAEKVPEWIQATLFMMAVSNSCMNPVVYGSYAINLRKEFCKYFCCLIPSSSSKNSVTIDSVITKSTTILHEVPARGSEKKYTIFLAKLSSNNSSNWTAGEEARKTGEEVTFRRNDFGVNHYHVENEGRPANGSAWHQLQVPKDGRRSGVN